MQKTRTRSSHHDEIDLHDDLEKIKAALREATLDVRGKAADMLSHSFDNVLDRTGAVKESAASFIEKKPFKSLGVAMLAGLIVGYLIHK